MRIFQIKDNSISEILEEKSGNKYFNYEKTIQNLIENNISKIFPGLEFLKSEYQIEDLRPDTIAFDKEKQSFVIIEYKNVENKSLVDQGVSYYQLLNDRRENFALLYSNSKGTPYNTDYFNWDETRIIFISPIFSKYQRRASGFQGLPIELYQIRNFQNNLITFDRIDTNADSAANAPSTKKQRQSIRLSEYSEDDYLAGKYHHQYPTQETKNLWFKLKNTILDSFENLEFRQKKIYGGFYSTEDGRGVCTIEAMKNKIILTYSTSKKGLIPISAFVEDVSNKGHHGVGSYQSKIENENDTTKAIPLIRLVYESA